MDGGEEYPVNDSGNAPSDRQVAGEPCPFIWFRDEAGDACSIAFEGRATHRTIGRSDECDVALGWDDQVSRAHAELVRVGGEWTVCDDGLSRNGTMVNGERITGRRRLMDRDVIRVGRTTLLYRVPAPGEEAATTVAPPHQYPFDAPTATQLKVLAALCRPCAAAQGFASPATNESISRELFLTVDAVKAHLRALFGKFAIGELPQNQKRMRLVQMALSAGTVDGLLRQRPDVERAGTPRKTPPPQA